MSETRHRVASVEDLREGERVITEIDGREIAVFNVEGEYYAMLNFCVHVGGPLCEGEVVNPIGHDRELNWTYRRDRHVVQCPWHGWQFDLETGANVESSRYRVPTYDVELDDGAVYVAL